MCGLVAVMSSDVSYFETNEPLLQAVQSIKHRGPDNQSIEQVDENVFLGHVRLSILDLNVQSNMPMTDSSSRYYIVFNGQIFNYRPLRHKLEGLGHVFKTSSDTEVLLHAFINWGKECVYHLEGMFAFVVYDKVEKCFFAARDHLGIKPLYYFQQKDRLIITSEIKAIKAVVGNLSLSKAALNEYLLCQNQLGSETLYKGVYLFPKGCFAQSKSNECSLSFNQYWEPLIREEEQSDIDLDEEFQEIFDNSIKTHINADCEVNAFLSGGLDSSAIASFSKKIKPDLVTFTCGFLNNSGLDSLAFRDERDAAKTISSFLSVRNVQIEISAQDMLTEIGKWAYHCEEPRVGSSFPNFKVSEKAAEFSKVCLSGTGGDELFGGYPWRYKDALEAMPNERFFEFFFENHLSKLFNLSEVSALVGLTKSDKQCLKEKAFSKFQLYNSRNHSTGLARNVNTILLFDMDLFLEGLLLMDDRVSMAHGLEVRYPFLDKKVVDFALKLPINKKIEIDQLVKNGSSEKTASGKVFLRQFLSKHLPQEICSASKQGFSPPFEGWYRNEFKSFIKDEVLSSRGALSNVIDISVAENFFDEFLEGRSRSIGKIWSFIALHTHLGNQLGEIH